MSKKIKKFIAFGAPKIGPEEIKAVVCTLKSSWIGTGPKVVQFEKNFKDYLGCRYAVAVNSCTAALHLSLLVHDIGPGDEVITTPLTYAATANVIVQVGAKPVFADVDLTTYNIDPQEIVKKISKKTKAIIPVHFGGLPCQMDEINALAKRHKLIVVEDAAHAIGARYHDTMIGNSQNLTCFSFYPNKNITTCEGGILATNRDHLIQRMKILRRDGLSQDAWGRFRFKKILPAQLVEPGFKYTMTDVQASIGIEQLKKVERWQSIREKYARIYDSYFTNLEGVFRQYRPRDLKKNRHSLHLYTLRIDPERFSTTRNHLIEKLWQQGIGVAVHYIPLHLHQYYQNKFRYRRGMFPNAEYIADNIFTLPLTPHLTPTQIRQIGQSVVGLLKKYQR